MEHHLQRTSRAHQLSGCLFKWIRRKSWKDLTQSSITAQTWRIQLLWGIVSVLRGCWEPPLAKTPEMLISAVAWKKLIATSVMKEGCKCDTSLDSHQTYSEGSCLLWILIQINTKGLRVVAPKPRYFPIIFPCQALWCWQVLSGQGNCRARNLWGIWSFCFPKVSVASISACKSSTSRENWQ